MPIITSDQLGKSILSFTANSQSGEGSRVSGHPNIEMQCVHTFLAVLSSTILNPSYVYY